MQSPKEHYSELIELLGSLKQRRIVHNVLNTIAARSPDPTLVALVAALQHPFRYTSTNPLHTPLQEMNACREQARALRLYCLRMLENQHPISD